MDPFIEVVFSEQADQVLRDRFEFPLFFIVGGADDNYLSNLIDMPIRQLVMSKSSNDKNGNGIVGVYASRSLLPTTGKALIFPLTTFLNDRWPILNNIESLEEDTKVPTFVERTWIIRALRRAGQSELANKVRNKMLQDIYPEKLKSYEMPEEFNLETFSQLYLKLSDTQRSYSLVILVDDLPVQLSTTIGETLQRLSLTGCAREDHLKALQTSIQLLQI